MEVRLKKLLLAVLAVVAVLMYVPALHTQSASANATLGVSKDTDVSFGGVQVGSTPILDPRGSAHSEVGAGATRGQFSVTGTITLGASGATLWLGGTLGDLTGQATGSYSTGNAGGTAVTVTVEYQ